jgi:hypothetical protein
MSNLITEIAMSHALPAAGASWHVPAPRERSLVPVVAARGESSVLVAHRSGDQPVIGLTSGKTCTTGAFAYRTYDPGSPSCRPPA